MRDNDKVTLVYSFDMLIPEGTSSIERRHKAIFQIHTNMGFNLIVKDGFAEFNCTVVNGNDNSIKYPVSEGEWHNFKYVLEVTKGNVVVNSYGICDGVKIYDRAIGRSGMDINTSSYKLVSIEMDSADAGKAYDTYFGGATFAKDNTFSMASVNTSLWDNRKVELVKDASGNVCAYAKNASGFSSGILVMAIYDKASGKLVEIIPSTTIVKGAFEGVVPAAKLSAGMEVKAFVFDAITTVNPLLPNGVLVY